MTEYKRFITKETAVAYAVVVSNYYGQEQYYGQARYTRWLAKATLFETREQAWQAIDLVPVDMLTRIIEVRGC